jgi:shikimate kinase
MDAPTNIVLVGFMGTGKTSVGKRLAEQLDMRFVDMDDVIEEREGKSIPRIFAEDGEPHFRSLERAVVRDLAARHGLVVATGGGIVLNADNISDYERTGIVVCLTATPDTILERVAKETQRPLLAGDGKMQKILDLLAARRRLYAGIRLQVDTTLMTVDQVADTVAGLYADAQTATDGNP